jgi:hypothetical protein
MRRKKFSCEEELTMVVQYTLGRCSREIGIILGRNPKVIQTWAKRHGIKGPKRGGATGAWNGSYKGGYRIDKYGYREVLCPEHPFARKNGCVAEHRLVMETYLNRYLKPTEVVHHKDGNKQNNDITNLELFESNAVHLKTELKGRIPNRTPEGHKRIRSAHTRRHGR